MLKKKTNNENVEKQWKHNWTIMNTNEENKKIQYNEKTFKKNNEN
jgi:hypothetical protein